MKYIATRSRDKKDLLWYIIDNEFFATANRITPNKQKVPLYKSRFYDMWRDFTKAHDNHHYEAPASKILIPISFPRRPDTLYVHTPQAKKELLYHILVKGNIRILEALQVRHGKIHKMCVELDNPHDNGKLLFMVYSSNTIIVNPYPCEYKDEDFLLLHK